MLPGRSSAAPGLALACPAAGLRRTTSRSAPSRGASRAPISAVYRPARHHHYRVVAPGIPVPRPGQPGQVRRQPQPRPPHPQRHCRRAGAACTILTAILAAAILAAAVLAAVACRVRHRSPPSATLLPDCPLPEIQVFRRSSSGDLLAAIVARIFIRLPRSAPRPSQFATSERETARTQP